MPRMVRREILRLAAKAQPFETKGHDLTDKQDLYHATVACAGALGGHDPRLINELIRQIQESPDEGRKERGL